MTWVPRFLVSFWAGLRVSRFRRRLKETGDGVAAQQAVLQQLLTQLAHTDLGQRQGLTPGMKYEEFQQTQPLVEHAHYAQFLERMMAGEANVIWPGQCHHFVETAGTTAGRPRLLPVTAEMLAHYRDGLRAALMSYTARTGHRSIFQGRALHVGGSTALRAAGPAAHAGSLDAMLHLAVAGKVERNLYAPAPEVARLPDGPEKAAAIARTCLAQDITLIGGTPASVRAVADAVLAPGSGGEARPKNLQAVWPRLECFLHTGAPLGLLGDELRARLGPGVHFHEAYLAAEGWFALQDNDPANGLRLLTDAGIFFEFLPMRDYRDDRPPHLGRSCVPLAQVKPGVDYALVVTTPAGLVRYFVGDVVRFISVNPPCLHVVGRAGLQLAGFGERIGERELTESLLEVCAQHEWAAVNFHVAPLVRRAGPAPRGAHEWWVELRPGTIKTPTGPYLAAALDAELTRRDRDYAQRRKSGAVEEPIVRLVMPGVFDQWAEESGVPLGTPRLPACRPDRLIADRLAAIARFYNESQPPAASVAHGKHG